MNEKNWKIDEEDGASIDSVSEVPIPWLGTSLKTWFEIEENQNYWTGKQNQAFENFVILSDNSKEEFIKELKHIYSKKLTERRIEETPFENILESIDWSKSHLCIPQLYDSDNEYALLLPETKWKIIDSNCSLELEFLYTNGKVELAQEMSGLWNRVEWFEYYLKRKTV